jgi:biofilm PGA synthesis N-glycosyltransferase PgaC
MLALIPAHNEETTVASAIHSVQEQHQELRLVVVTDNCTDRTDEVARGAGAETFAPEGNQHKKAGALNQALAALLPNMDDDDFVFVMDADTVLNPDWMRTARAALDADPKAGAVGGIFLGDPDGGLLGQLQRNEYQRYRGDVLLRRNKAMVLTGTSPCSESGCSVKSPPHEGTCCPARQDRSTTSRHSPKTTN